MTQDEEYLRLLSIFHYVVGGIAALFSLFPLIHLAIGLLFIFSPQTFADGRGGQPPVFIGWIFIIIATILITCGLTLATLIITTGRFLARRTHYTFCLVMAGIECIFTPFGTVLGVFTLITLMRDTVKRLFGVSVPGTI